MSDFQVKYVGDLRVISFEGAHARGINADMYWSRDCYGRYWEDYAFIVPRFRPEYPSVQEFSDSSLEYLLGLMWPQGLPELLAEKLKNGKVAVFESHAAQYEDIGWAASVDDGLVPVRDLVEWYLRLKYDCIVIATCNPDREDLTPVNCLLTYPLGILGPDQSEFEMRILEKVNLS